MDEKLIENIVNATLYEGYLLYPYRASSVKNLQRFNFGVLAPKIFSQMQYGTDTWQMQTECLVLADDETTIDVKINFLHLLSREIGKVNESVSEWKDDLTNYETVSLLEIDGKIFQTWEEATERKVEVSSLSLRELLNHTHTQQIFFSANKTLEPLRNRDEKIVGVIIRCNQTVTGEIELKAEPIHVENLYKVSILISNTTPFETVSHKSRNKVLSSSFVSTHTILHIHAGKFISLLDTPEEYKDVAASCQNVGTFPVLVGEEGTNDSVLSSPIILHDYPQIAPESAGDMFDGTEIDELLVLRIMTMTDEEKHEMRQTDERAKKILEQTEKMSHDDLMKLHGTLRSLRNAEK
jgi:hydrogenase maturation protease